MKLHKTFPKACEMSASAAKRKLNVLPTSMPMHLQYILLIMAMPMAERIWQQVAEWISAAAVHSSKWLSGLDTA